MIIYKDIITGDEMISDSFDPVEVDNIVYEVNCAMITEGAVAVNTGANASAEEAEEEVEDGAVQVNNVVNSFRLQSTQFDKKSYLTHLKGYMKTIKTKLKEKGASDDEVAAFEKGAGAFAKKIVANFKDYDFYVGESMDPDGMVALMNYREDGVTPYITVWKHGLIEEKV
ncbi:hypothetical protein V491_01203 [Pseudogymnoascus sp. VKM F-3775]|nr:hypothetical protein V491_01203 [Pseudogymnoascus sp. VKM F-3775]